MEAEKAPKSKSKPHKISKRALRKRKSNRSPNRGQTRGFSTTAVSYSPSDNYSQNMPNPASYSPAPSNPNVSKTETFNKLVFLKEVNQEQITNLTADVDSARAHLQKAYKGLFDLEKDNKNLNDKITEEILEINDSPAIEEELNKVEGDFRKADNDVVDAVQSGDTPENSEYLRDIERANDDRYTEGLEGVLHKAMPDTSTTEDVNAFELIKKSIEEAYQNNQTADEKRSSVDQA